LPASTWLHVISRHTLCNLAAAAAAALLVSTTLVGSQCFKADLAPRYLAKPG
jgi:hypothetical protein